MTDLATQLRALADRVADLEPDSVVADLRALAVLATLALRSRDEVALPDRTVAS